MNLTDSELKESKERAKLEIELDNLKTENDLLKDQLREFIKGESQNQTKIRDLKLQVTRIGQKLNRYKGFYREHELFLRIGRFQIFRRKTHEEEQKSIKAKLIEMKNKLKAD